MFSSQPPLVLSHCENYPCWNTSVPLLYWEEDYISWCGQCLLHRIAFALHRTALAMKSSARLWKAQFGTDGFLGKTNHSWLPLNLRSIHWPPHLPIVYSLSSISPLPKWFTQIVLKVEADTKRNQFEVKSQLNNQKMIKLNKSLWDEAFFSKSWYIVLILLWYQLPIRDQLEGIGWPDTAGSVQRLSQSQNILTDGATAAQVSHEYKQGLNS